MLIGSLAFCSFVCPFVCLFVCVRACASLLACVFFVFVRSVDRLLVCLSVHVFVGLFLCLIVRVVVCSRACLFVGWLVVLLLVGCLLVLFARG